MKNFLFTFVCLTMGVIVLACLNGCKPNSNTTTNNGCDTFGIKRMINEELTAFFLKQDQKKQHVLDSITILKNDSANQAEIMKKDSITIAKIDSAYAASMKPKTKRVKKVTPDDWFELTVTLTNNGKILKQDFYIGRWERKIPYQETRPVELSFKAPLKE